VSLHPIEGGDGAPAEPDWTLTYSDPADVQYAHEQWGVVLREMREAQTLVVANGHMVVRLVNFRIVYERAAQDIAERGAILEAKRTKVPQTNANWAVMRQADEAIRAIEAELGVSPLRRNRVGKVTRAKKAPRAADKYLKQVPG
jgi:P27 family predicted phage terminase small subunit